MTLAVTASCLDVVVDALLMFDFHAVLVTSAHGKQHRRAAILYPERVNYHKSKGKPFTDRHVRCR